MSRTYLELHPRLVEAVPCVDETENSSQDRYRERNGLNERDVLHDER